MSWILFVDFDKRKLVCEVKEVFNKQALYRQGLINYERLQRRGEVHEVTREFPTKEELTKESLRLGLEVRRRP